MTRRVSRRCGRRPRGLQQPPQTHRTGRPAFSSSRKRSASRAASWAAMVVGGTHPNRCAEVAAASQTASRTAFHHQAKRAVPVPTSPRALRRTGCRRVAVEPALDGVPDVVEEVTKQADSGVPAVPVQVVVPIVFVHVPAATVRQRVPAAETRARRLRQVPQRTDASHSRTTRPSWTSRLRWSARRTAPRKKATGDSSPSNGRTDPPRAKRASERSGRVTY